MNKILLILSNVILYLVVVLLFLVWNFTYMWYLILVLILNSFLSYFIGKSYTEEKIINFFITSIKNQIKNAEEQEDNNKKV